jgi:hypothetical protein
MFLITKHQKVSVNHKPLDEFGFTGFSQQVVQAVLCQTFFQLLSSVEHYKLVFDHKEHLSGVFPDRVVG